MTLSLFLGKQRDARNAAGAEFRDLLSRHDVGALAAAAALIRVASEKASAPDASRALANIAHAVEFFLERRGG